MRFLNFDLDFDLGSPISTISLVALGLHWDLHNWPDFAGLQLTPDGSAVLTWIAPDSHWSDERNHYRGCELRFRGVRSLEITGPDPEMPASEHRTLWEISKLTPEHPEYGQATKSGGTSFKLGISFNGGLSIKVDAEEADLRPLEHLASP